MLANALEHQLQDLKLISLIYVSNNSQGPDIQDLKEATAFHHQLIGFKQMIELGITCANEEIEISYTSGEHHVLVKSFTEDNPKRNFQGNKDRVLSILGALHKIKPINHLHARNLDLVQLETKFLGEAIQYHKYSAPQPQ